MSNYNTGQTTYYEYPAPNINYKPYDNLPDNSQWTRLGDDIAYIDDKANRSRRPLRYITRDFHNQGLNPNSLGYPGFFPQDGEGIHPSGINIDSAMRYSALTNQAFPQQLPCLPVPTIPLLQKGCLDVKTEMELRGKDTYADKACNPKDSTFYERFFQTPAFEALCYNPNHPDISVFPACNQTGIDTRHLRTEPYRSGLHCSNLQLAVKGGARTGNCSFRQSHPYAANRYNSLGQRVNLNGYRYDHGQYQRAEFSKGKSVNPKKYFKGTKNFRSTTCRCGICRKI